MLRDLRYAFRQLRLTPIVTSVAVLSLALGAGANTAIFTLINALVLRPLPVHDATRLVELTDSSTNPVWEDLRARQDAFTGVLAYSSTTFNLARRGPVRTAEGLMISGGAFDVLGVQPLLGRLITAADDRRDGGRDGPSAVLSYGFWQREFGGLPTVVGQTIFLDGHAFTVVGVTPRQFTGLVVGDSFDVAVPINAQATLRGADHMLDNRHAWWLFVVGRLAPGQTIEDAERRLRAVQPQVRMATLPPDRSAEETADYLKEPWALQSAGGAMSLVKRRYTQPLFVLMGIAGLVLLVACANLANLLLARAAARQRELAVRLSLGASRRQLMRQLLIESLLLAAIGAAAGAAVAQVASRGLVRMISTRTDVVFLDLSIDARVMAFSLAIATVTAMLFGLAPAFRGTSLRPADGLRQGGRGVTGSRRRFGVGPSLVAAQVALSLVLVFAAALFVRSFVGLAAQPLGFDADRILAVTVDMRPLNAQRDAQLRIAEQIVERIRSVPGVASAATGFVTPVSSGAWILDVQMDGYTPRSERDGRSFHNGVSPGYFRTMGTALIAGRDFTGQDRAGAPPVAIVNEAFARKFTPGRSPLGLTFSHGSPQRRTTATIVGVVGDTKYRYLREETSAVVYVPVAQQAASFFNTTLYVRSTLEPASLTGAVTSAIAEVSPDVTLRFGTLSEIVGAAMSSERVVAVLSGVFGVLALVLAMVGLYGVMAYAVTRRRSEIGVRMALGANPGRVLAMIMRDVVLVTVAGLAVGAAAALASGRFVAHLLYGVEPRDVMTLAVAVAALTMASALAGYLPARRAARVNPMVALRDD